VKKELAPLTDEFIRAAIVNGNIVPPPNDHIETVPRKIFIGLAWAVPMSLLLWGVIWWALLAL